MPQNPNPYKFDGPLAPEDEEDKFVCIPRTKIVDKIVQEIKRGAYWAIMGPRQIGKTTLLRLVQKKYPQPYYIYFDFGVKQPDKESFYQWFMDEFLSQLPTELQNLPEDNGKNLIPELKFRNFLEKFAIPENKKIIFLFDEIDDLPHLSDFLDAWRTIYNIKHYKKGLKNYSVIITGSVNLIAQTIGPNSPFNIAKKYNIEDFSIEESKELIEKPFEQLSITIEEEAKDHLISQTSGHPQLLQHLCHILVEKQKKPIKTEDVDEAISELFKTNSTLDILRESMYKDAELADLLRQLLDGNPIKYLPYKKFSSFGVGAIKSDENNFCEIRNTIYKKYLTEMLTPKKDEEKKKEVEEKSQEEEEKEKKIEEKPQKVSVSIIPSPEKIENYARLSIALGIIIGFFSVMFRFSPGIYGAASLAALGLLLFLFSGKKK